MSGKLSAGERGPHTASAMLKARHSALAVYCVTRRSMLPLYPNAEQLPQSVLRVATDSFPHQQKENFCLPKVHFLFIQAAGLVYHRRAKCGVYHQGRVAPLYLITRQRASFLRLDDIQTFGLMIYTPHGVICFETTCNPRDFMLY